MIELIPAMAPKKIIAIVLAALLAGLMIWANMADNPADSISEGSTGTPVGLEKNHPTEERIPTH